MVSIYLKIVTRVTTTFVYSIGFKGHSLMYECDDF